MIERHDHPIFFFYRTLLAEILWQRVPRSTREVLYNEVFLEERQYREIFGVKEVGQ